MYELGKKIKKTIFPDFPSAFKKNSRESSLFPSAIAKTLGNVRSRGLILE
jgi:hypothetical protein